MWTLGSENHWAPFWRLAPTQFSSERKMSSKVKVDTYQTVSISWEWNYPPNMFTLTVLKKKVIFWKKEREFLWRLAYSQRDRLASKEWIFQWKICSSRNHRHLVDIVSLLIILYTDIQLKQTSQLSRTHHVLCLIQFNKNKKKGCTLGLPRNWNFKAGSKYHNK